MKQEKKLFTALLEKEVIASFKAEAKRRGVTQTGLLRQWIARAEQRREVKK